MRKRENSLIDLIKKLKINDSTSLTTKPIESIFLEETAIKENDGFIEVRDHQLFVIDGKADGRQPTLLPTFNLRITVNGRLLTKERVVFSKDQIIVQNNSSAPGYTIQVSKDQLFVYLQIYPELFLTYQLKNKKRATQLMLEMEATPNQFDVEEACSQIVEELMKKGIQVEVNTTLIIQELMNPSFKPILIAEGLPIIPSVDAQLESFILNEIKEVIEEVDGKADFKNRLKIPSVDAGEIIAQIHPPKEGKDGYNIFGIPLQPKPPKKIDVKAKARVRITEDGKVIALQNGRPSITGRTVKHIDILDTYVVHGDVCMKTGNIYFSGDVIVKGDVKDNMSVECSGSIYVYGNVYHAKLTATQHIYVFGTVINSKVIAGQLSVFYSSTYKLSQDISISIQKLIQALKQLETSLQEKGITFEYGHVLCTLIETKFNRLPKIINEFYTIMEDIPKKTPISVKFRIILNTLSKLKDYHSIRSINSENELNSILFSIKEVILEMESMVAENSQVQVASANMSTIKTNGDLTVKKEGVIHSNLFAGSHITFDQLDSVIRGGKIEALKSIRAGVVGTILGDPPELYAGELISIGKIFQGVVKFPNYYSFIDQETTNVILKFDPTTEEVISSSK